MLAPCSQKKLTDVSEVLTTSSATHHLGKEALITSETSIDFYETTRRNIPEEVFSCNINYISALNFRIFLDDVYF
jgi:hypothetical protein